jgi:acyl-CoA thioesterase I
MAARGRETIWVAAWTCLRERATRTYRHAVAKFQRSLRSWSAALPGCGPALFAGGVLCLALAAPPVQARGSLADGPIRIVALGDSLTAGLGVAESESFPAQLQRALAEKGLKVEIVNAGVSGDTASGGLSRLDWSVPDDVHGVIVELGANDALRGIDPEVTRKALDDILARLGQRGIPALLAGMQAPRNLGADYAARFDAIYPGLAAKHGVVFYPFFLEGVAADRALNQADGIHPNAQGVAAIVRAILPKVEELVARIRSRQP